MRILIILITILSLNSAFAQDNQAQWLLNIDSAKVISNKENKVILIVFSGSDWCRPCIKLKQEILDSDDFLNYSNESLVLVEADFPRSKKNKLSDNQLKHNELLASKFNKSGAFPHLVLINSEEEILGVLAYKNITPKEYIGLINNIIKK